MSSTDRELVTVYEAANPAEAHIVCNMLLDEGLAAQVVDENDAFSGVSSLNVAAVVVPRADEVRAQVLVAEYEAAQADADDDDAEDDSE
ncbi:MAG: DUF2007 domain-containing protein [Planctomycetaceae bacterium]|nr:DUF2007 domain-containing protein [Planctomycetaceae bacterium]